MVCDLLVVCRTIHPHTHSTSTNTRHYYPMVDFNNMDGLVLVR